MPDSTMTPPHHYPTLHEVWEEIHTVAGESLVSHWLTTLPMKTISNQSLTGYLSQPLATKPGNRRKKMKRFREVSELVDPRPSDGSRLLYRGMPLLPVAYEFDWMASDNLLQRAIIQQMFGLGWGIEFADSARSLPLFS